MLLYKYQFGFRSNHSTHTFLSYLNDYILKGFDRDEITGMILIDLQKALDTIDHICQTGLSLSTLKIIIVTLTI